ncbi:hypothetical protein KIP69_03480 [Geobacter sulfurreducens]|uniref:hypothetical protein n=1 Tax=Geobacter sulfurreducens TaxID=35554 RepID=UPI001BDC0010|nr:hypothetical protein [Geobacter sulfurreducens]QVW35924.1 hypothetical protein KIP69_03480 [Geobacter sulfurreducens]
MRNNPKILEASKRVFAELRSLSNEELNARLESRELGSIGSLVLEVGLIEESILKHKGIVSYSYASFSSGSIFREEFASNAVSSASYSALNEDETWLKAA